MMEDTNPRPLRAAGLAASPGTGLPLLLSDADEDMHQRRVNWVHFKTLALPSCSATQQKCLYYLLQQKPSQGLSISRHNFGGTTTLILVD